MKIQINIDGKNIDAEISEEDAKALGLLDKRPQTGYERVEEKECYFVIGAAGDVSKQIECKAISDQRRRDCGNYYNDETVAENNARADRLLRCLRQWQASHDRAITLKDWKNTNISKYKIKYSYTDDCVFACEEYGWRELNVVYFSSTEKAEQAIEAFKHELFWYYTEYMQRLDEIEN